MPAGKILGAFTGQNQADAAKAAAGAQVDATKSGIAAMLYMYGQGRHDLSPWLRTGRQGLRTLSNLYGLNGQKPYSADALHKFYASPDYKVARHEGINALDASAASRGNLLSGGQVKDLADYGSKLGTLQFGNYANRLAGFADAGQQAAARTASNAMTAGSNLSSLWGDIGADRASGIVGSANAYQGGFNNMFNTGASLLSAYSGSNPFGGGGGG